MSKNDQKSLKSLKIKINLLYSVIFLIWSCYLVHPPPIESIWKASIIFFDKLWLLWPLQVNFLKKLTKFLKYLYSPKNEFCGSGQFFSKNIHFPILEKNCPSLWGVILWEYKYFRNFLSKFFIDFQKQENSQDQLKNLPIFEKSSVCRNISDLSPPSM